MARSSPQISPCISHSSSASSTLLSPSLNTALNLSSTPIPPLKPLSPLPHSHLFPPLSSLPPLRPNTDPRCNSFTPPLVSISPFNKPFQRVSTPLVRDSWAFYLQDYPDRGFVSSLLNIIDYGANIGFSGPEVVLPAKNLKSAFDDLAFMDSAVEKLVQNAQVHGPFDLPPIADLRCSPLGSVTRKRNPDKRRLINHLSWPIGLSVNDGIPDSEAYISYDMFERAVEDLIRSGPGSLMAKLDLKEAFRHIPIRAEDWHHLGFAWRSRFYYCTVLTFGLRSAPYIFNLFAEALHWIIQRHIPSYMRHYLDDFLLTFSPSSVPSWCSAAVEWVMGLGQRLGLCFQDSKTVWPSTQIEFLGLELDSLKMEARLPPDKLEFLMELLRSWARKRVASLRETQELAGFLQFASQVIPYSRPFIRRIIDFSMKFSSSFQRLHVPSGVLADLRWWLTYCTPWNGIRLLQPSKPSVSIFTDASGTKGLGGVYDDHWFSTRCPRRYRSRDIQFKEAYAVLQAILRWGDMWSGCHVLFHVDNEAVFNWLRSGSGRSPNSMGVVRMIFMLAAFLNFSFSSVWISTSENALADAASRFQYSRLFQLRPTLDRVSSSTKSQITGIKRTLSSLDVQHSTSGTGSLPVPANPTLPGRRATLISSSSIPHSSLSSAHTSLQHPTQLPNGCAISQIVA